MATDIKARSWVEIPIEKGVTTPTAPSKLMYITKVAHEENKVYGYMLDYQVQTKPEYPWDYASDTANFAYEAENMRVWVPYQFNLDGMYDADIEQVENIETHADYEKTKEVKEWERGGREGGERGPLYYRIAGDRRVQFGDGGNEDLIYPVWVAPELRGVEEEKRDKLCSLLRKLSNKRKDFHTNSPVRDIIDPDLCPRLKEKPNFAKSKLEEYNLMIQRGARISDKRNVRSIVEGLAGTKFTGRDFYLEKLDKLSENSVTRALQDGNEEMVEKLISPKRIVDRVVPNAGISMRDMYQWIPSTFRIHEDGRVEICTPINGMSNRELYSEFYTLIEHIFEKMVPLFNEIHLIKKDGPTELQVIVKAQEYYLAPGMTYAGRWHMEGQTENIVAAGVYYLDVGDTQGGNLKFRPKEIPQDWYGFTTDYEVAVKTGTAVVFANSLPHRFRKIRNNSNSPQFRTFVNFFVVDPLIPIPPPFCYAFGDFVKLCLRRAFKDATNKEMYSFVMASVLKYITPKLWANLEEGKQFRKKAREAMLTNTSGWGWIHWGNCGFCEFVGSWSLYSQNRQDETKTLRHTESDT